jgi:hypothetical protein
MTISRREVPRGLFATALNEYAALHKTEAAKIPVGLPSGQACRSRFDMLVPRRKTHGKYNPMFWAAAITRDLDDHAR